MVSDLRFVAVAALLALPAFASPDALVGSGVGNADTFVSEGSKLFNKKQYAKAADQFLKATRANPANAQTYVQLARAQMLAKQLPLACYAYRVYLKSVPDSPDRKKAAAESDQCERQLKGLKKQPDDPTKGFVDLRAQFFASLDAKSLLGAGSATESLKTLVRDGFLGPELGEMAQKLGAAATAEAESIHKRALDGEKLSADVLRSARPLYAIALDVGAASSDAKARTAFLDGLAELGEKNHKRAEAHFAEAAKADPSNKEYAFFRALALFEAGERPAALKVLEAELKDDPRTAVLRTSLAVGQSPEAGAAELEKLLFTNRFPPEK
ncbi:MAG: tetratricopeptide repeat protein [Myxococcota bacterium]